MADPDDLFYFNLSDPAGLARWQRIHTPQPGERLSSPLRRQLDEVLADWNQPPEVIDAIRSRVEESLAHMDAIEEHACHALAALQDPMMAVARVQATGALKLAAVEPYARAGRAVVEARAAGGRAKARNTAALAWHTAVHKAAQQLRDAGVPDRNLVGILVKRFPYSDDAVRRVLRKRGVLPANNG
ncbi:hypothetical protein [Xanthomonas arboricola]|uniref:hypothetical protein n=1 Tax=Xanthomonas arboricola TaxID=56448 RepID=UPI00161FBE4F|nr:hypothetical protein [Xanthomonas arboricola]MBB5676413.1 hypothetical protein [Xanthomonas arboricola]